MPRTVSGEILAWLCSAKIKTMAVKLIMVIVNRVILITSIISVWNQLNPFQH